MTVSLLEIFAAARAHAAPLAAESAGYLLLAVADHVAFAPREVRADDVELGADGSVRLRASRGQGVAEGGAERAVRRLLERALAVSSSVGPGLRRAAARREAVGLDQLVRELETALIPVNRSAAKRALSRLYRETDRARVQGKLGKLVDDDVESAAAPVEAAAPALAPREVPVAVTTLPPVAPVCAAPEPADVLAGAAEFPEVLTPTPPRPVVVAAPPVLLTLSPPAPAVVPAPAPAEELTPEPLLAHGEAALTKPEPVVERARERGSRTPRLGTAVTAQTFPGEEADLTERVPAVLVEAEADDDIGIDIDIDVRLEEVVAEPVIEAPVVAAEPQPLLDPDPSCMPDVVMAMLALHTGVESDEAPTRLRDVVTAPREPEPEPVVQTSPALPHTPEPEQVDDAWLTQSSLEDVATLEVDVPPLELVRPFISELADPVLHEALTWDPGPVVSSLRSPLPPALLLAEPLPEPSPYVPAVLPARSSDVSELVDSFYVTGAAEERDLRGALKEMAGLELTPMPHPLVRIP